MFLGGNMNILVITANQVLYAAEGKMNEILSGVTKNFFKEGGHTVLISDIGDGKWDINEEVSKLKQADIIIYHHPMWWFNMPNILKKYLDEVLLYNETFVITEVYGEGGQLQNKKFMVTVTSNMKKSDLGTAPILKKYHSIDDILVPLIITNQYLGIREQIPTFHADDIIKGDTTNTTDVYLAHLQQQFK